MATAETPPVPGHSLPRLAHESRPTGFRFRRRFIESKLEVRRGSRVRGIVEQVILGDLQVAGGNQIARVV